MKFALLDFETASQCDLKKSGAARYAEDPTTELLCLGFTIDGDPNELLDPAHLGFDPDSRLGQAACDPTVTFIAHNAAFEKYIWRALMIPLGWPDIPNERWHCTQAACAMKGLPLKLERAAMALRLNVQKDTAGTKATIALGKTNKKGYFDRTPEKLQRVYDYCALGKNSDVSAELELHRRVRGLGSMERRVWLLDQTINERGVCLDMEFVEAAQIICDEAAKPLAKEFETLTGGIEVTQDKQFKGWLVEHGCPFPIGEDGEPQINLQKETVLKLLGEKDDEAEDSLADEDEDYTEDRSQLVLPFAYRRPLEIRKMLGSASIKKLKAMRACVGFDGRARGLLQYHGAGPGRWAGRLLQPQNFPRPSLKIDGEGHDTEQLVEAILTRDYEFVQCMFGEPINAVASGLRHAIIAADGKLLEVGDFKTIEARIVLAIAGARNALEIIKSGRDIYIEMAQTIFHQVVDKKRDPELRQTGKNTVLGCGFQMGAPKFRARYAQKETLEFAKRCIDAYRKDFAPEVPKLWYGLEAAAVKAVWDRVPTEAYGIEYRLEDGWLTARLHSGRKLWYRDPRPVRKAMPWDKDDVRPGFVYRAWKLGQWKQINAYGGLLTENVVQAEARDLLVNGLFNCEANGHPVILTVHDEAINEVDEALASAKTLDGFMCDVPDWAKQLDIPVESDCWVGGRYKK